MKPSKVIVASLLLAVGIPSSLLATTEVLGFKIAPESQWLNLPVFLILSIPTLIIAIWLLQHNYNLYPHHTSKHPSDDDNNIVDVDSNI